MSASDPPEPAPITLPFLIPRVTFALLALTVASFVLQIASQVSLEADWLVAYGAKFNHLIRAGQLWRLVTPIFLHGSTLHLGFNLFVLLVLGIDLERSFGHLRFLLLYLLGGFAGYALSFLLWGGGSLGASTAVFALIGAEGIFHHQNRRIAGLQRPKWLVGIVIFVIGVVLLSEDAVLMDIWGHLGGILGGMIFTWFAGPRLAITHHSVVDHRAGRDVVLGTGITLVIFTSLVIGGMAFPLPP